MPIPGAEKAREFLNYTTEENRKTRLEELEEFLNSVPTIVQSFIYVDSLNEKHFVDVAKLISYSQELIAMIYKERARSKKKWDKINESVEKVSTLTIESTINQCRYMVEDVKDEASDRLDDTKITSQLDIEFLRGKISACRIILDKFEDFIKC